MLVFLKAPERFGKRHNRLRYYALSEVFIPNFCYHLNSVAGAFAYYNIANSNSCYR